MTHEEYNILYNTGQISVKAWYGKVDGCEKSIEAFTHGGKYYLRIIGQYPYIITENGKKFMTAKEYKRIKIFDSRKQANSYFKRIAVGLQRLF